MNSDILISLEALANMIKYDISVKGKETAGLLIGEEKDGIVHIDEVRIGNQVANAVHVEISIEELIEATVEVSERPDGKSVVGWIHTHPGLTAFLSPTDVNTQNNYQALYPKAVAIVVDSIKYSHTLDLRDLDLGVFRVVDGRQVRQNYAIKESTEFGLKAFVTGDGTVQKKRESRKPIVHAFAPMVDKNQLVIMKANVEKLFPKMSEQDRIAIQAWIEIADAMQSGDYKEVPIDVVNLNERLTESIDKIDDNIYELEFNKENRSAEWGLLSILAATAINFALLFLV